jgi:hypothetical protein
VAWQLRSLVVHTRCSGLVSGASRFGGGGVARQAAVVSKSQVPLSPSHSPPPPLLYFPRFDV